MIDTTLTPEDFINLEEMSSRRFGVAFEFEKDYVLIFQLKDKRLNYALVPYDYEASDSFPPHNYLITGEVVLNSKSETSVYTQEIADIVGIEIATIDYLFEAGVRALIRSVRHFKELK